ncbi:MAG: helicase, partial [Planctomycetes bacterium]|nr:helicase [Planctomycetota bacterium]
MRDVRLVIPDEVADFLRGTIQRARGNEVFFFGRVEWDEGLAVATLDEVDVVARGNSVSVVAILERADQWDIAIHNHPSGGLEPSDADAEIAYELGVRSVGFAIIDNDARRHYLVVPPYRQEGPRLVDPEQIRRIFAPDGPLARRLDGYETRAAQVEMALEVTRALNEKRVVACEAGTGVGKSFAYLVPSILWAVGNRQRVVVSTGTIHLQEQLVAKDLPLLEKVLDVEFHYSLIKGRSNYACLRKISLLPEEFLVDPPPEEEKRALHDIAEWARTTRDGSLADLGWVPPPEIWERVQSETDKSLKVNCPHYQECFFYEAKRRAFKAHVVVANHHLFFADLAVRLATGNYRYDLILPGYRRVVFDEAHHLEDASSDHLGLDISRRGLRQRLGRLRSRDGRRGTLPILIRQLDGWGDPAAAGALRDDFSEKLPAIAERIEESLQEIEDRVEEETSPLAFAESGSDGEPTRATRTIRLRPERGITPLWEVVRGRLAAIRRDLELISRLNDAALKRVRAARILEEKRDGACLELESFGGRLESLLGDLDRFRDYEDTALVRWIEYRPAAG